MQTAAGQPGRFIQSEHKIHVLDPDMGSALSDTIENTEDHDTIPGLIHI
jgi:hypothetical protein